MKKSKRKSENTLRKNKSTTFQNLWDLAKAVLREKFSNTGLSQEMRKISNNLTLHLKELEKE